MTNPLLRQFVEATQTGVGRTLDFSQLRAVSAPAGQSQFVVAGPGSGKTTVLATRVLRLAVVDGVEPQAIVATTFTRKAAKELRSRILGWGDRVRATMLAAGVAGPDRDRIEQLDFNAIWTGTLDSATETILGQHRAPGTQPPSVIEDFVANALMLRRGMFEGGRYRDASLAAFVTAVRGPGFPPNATEMAGLAYTFHQRIINDDVDVGAFLSTTVRCGLCPDHPHAGITVLGAALDDYSTHLRDIEVLDYASLERAFLTRLRDGSLEPFTRELRHVLVDEYQDTNSLQEAIYFEMARSAIANGGAITVVGDDDQSLYRFRGATVELFSGFPTRIDGAVGQRPRTTYLSRNYRSTEEIVAFCNGYVTNDPGYAVERVADKPAITFQRTTADHCAVVGMFRADVATLAHDLAQLIDQLFRPPHTLRLPSGTEITPDAAGTLADCSLLTYSPREYASSGRSRLPLLLRQELENLTPPILTYNPRGQPINLVTSVSQLCGLLLECIDPGATVQAAERTLPRAVSQAFTTWRAAGRALATRSPTLRRYVRDWTTRTPRAGGAWPNEVALGDLAYKLVSWIPSMQDDVEGLVYFEVILRTLTQASRFSRFGGYIVFRTPALATQSIRATLWDVLLPIANGAVDVEEDLLETLPPGRFSVLSIHQSKGLEFPLTIVDVGSDFRVDHPKQRRNRFPEQGDMQHRLEDELRRFSGTVPMPARTQLDRAFDDLTRTYFVAYSRARDVLLLVGLNSALAGLRSIATGWRRDGTEGWPRGLTNLELI